MITTEVRLRKNVQNAFFYILFIILFFSFILLWLLLSVLHDNLHGNQQNMKLFRSKFLQFSFNEKFTHTFSQFQILKVIFISYKKMQAKRSNCTVNQKGKLMKINQVSEKKAWTSLNLCEMCPFVESQPTNPWSANSISSQL